MADAVPLSDPVEEPDLHDLDPIPLDQLGVPDAAEISEAQWLGQNEEDYE